MATKAVLIVDDEPEIRQLVSVMLRDRCDVVEAQDGIEALRMLDREFVPGTSTGRICVVISDIAMPGMDGLTLCRRIKAEFGLPVIMLTAKTNSTFVIAAKQAGADGFVAKPFTWQSLLNKLAKYIF